MVKGVILYVLVGIRLVSQLNRGKHFFGTPSGVLFYLWKGNNKTMDYSQFKSWRTNHATDMSDLTYSKPFDVFIYTKVKINNEIYACQVLFAEDLEETAGYFAHIFILDLLTDKVDDLEFDFENCTDICQGDVISLMNYRFKLQKIFGKDNFEKSFFDICQQFNKEFEGKYEFCVLGGADKLRKFLVSRYSSHNDEIKQKLGNFCSKELFAGKLLNDFLKNIL